MDLAHPRIGSEAIRQVDGFGWLEAYLCSWGKCTTPKLGAVARGILVRMGIENGLYHQTNPHEHMQNPHEDEPKMLAIEVSLHGDIPSNIEAQARETFAKVAAEIEREWGVQESIPVSIDLMTEQEFRALAEGPNDPALWKYCFLMCSPPINKVYLRSGLFEALPNDAKAMIKHEISHIVLYHLVGKPAYHNSYFLAEGTAGLDNATERLVAKLRQEKRQDIPDPLSVQSEASSKAVGGDTNLEPFTEQLGELVIASAVEFLRKRHGEQKVIELYKAMDADTSLEDAYAKVFGDSIKSVFDDWKEEIASPL